MKNIYYHETNALYSLCNKVDDIVNSKVEVATSLFSLQEIVEGIDEKNSFKRKSVLEKCIRASGINIFPYVVRECIGTAFNLDLSMIESILIEKQKVWQEVGIIKESKDYKDYSKRIGEVFGEDALKRKQWIEEDDKKLKDSLSKCINDDRIMYKKIIKEQETHPTYIEMDVNKAFGFERNEKEIERREDPFQKLCDKLLLPLIESLGITYDEFEIEDIIKNCDKKALTAYMFGTDAYSKVKMAEMFDDHKLAERNDINDLTHLLYLRDENYIIVSNDKIFEKCTFKKMRMSTQEFMNIVNKDKDGLSIVDGKDQNKKPTNEIVKHVYIVGSKSIGQYGGYESFVMNLLQHHKYKGNIKYHVICKANGQGYMDIDRLPGAERVNEKEFTYCNAQCILIDIPEKLGAAQAIYYDLKALKWCCDHIEKNHIEEPIVYILASRVGPFEKQYVNRIHKCGGQVWQNPDGWEHARRKWNKYIRKYWKLSEKYAVKYADLIVCDSKHIESYIQDEYSCYNPKTTFIAYGSYITPSKLNDDDPKYTGWLREHKLRDKEYYLSVGRFVPENNFDVMIREFMRSKTDKDFAIITTENPKYAEELQQKFNFKGDKRIKFVGTVYDAELLKKIRENAYGYFHGHEVGGTNPSLLESLGSTKVNLLFDVGFNKEVAEDAAFYWNKEEGSLVDVINKCDAMSEEQRNEMGQKAKKRIEDGYSWEYICDMYEKAILSK
ncbi:Glycosyltransferase involved in cell wall bisynthesis [Oribacterium sp. KHPX15]|uniref:beta 1-4 rhamnosyltransferase Cps2T n=1 Tax=Oribacterium sp. KHPX15 TaxID=1855342 RepID=UPI0008998677|nr:DUF1972 domain-containing protein [Oribacterium sp. KHPX15]SEA56707.1 Glycosyltransferase involved in cell wall bisynthesis [Oribacterium sp. KHPX15]